MKDLLLILSENWLSLALLCVSAIPAAYMALHDTGKAKWFGPKGGACFGIMALDYAMHKNCDIFEIWSCTSFIGRFFMILGGIIMGGNIAGRILIVLWMGLKWVGSKLMGAVTL